LRSQFLQRARIHLPDRLAAGAECTKPARAEFVNEDFTENAARRVSRAQNQDIYRHAGNYIPNEALRGSGSLDVGSAVVRGLFFRDGLRRVHRFVGNAEQVPEFLAMLGHQCNTDTGRALYFLPLDDVGL